jgi:hypothetical protein
MADNDVSVESVEISLLSEIKMSSATSIKGAYLPHTGGTADDGPVPTVQPGTLHPEKGQAGPNALVYGTKISTRTPVEVIERRLGQDPDRETILRTHDFYTMVLAMSMSLGDPSTTHLINGTIDLTLPPETIILDYSPKDKGTVTAVIENAGDTISISPDLVITAPPARSPHTTPDSSATRFSIPASPEKTLNGTYNRKTGYSIDLPAGTLLEYQGMITNPHEMFWEIYPPMPPADIIISGTAMLVLFSFIIRTPKKIVPEIRVNIDCRVKGNLWGVVPLRGSAVFR